MKKILFVLVLSPLVMFSQLKAIKEADKKVKNFEYLDAIKIYERLDKKGQSSPDVISKIANLYYDNARYINANEWYGKLYSMTPQMSSENHYRYSQTLKTVGEIEKSNEQLALFKKMAPSQIRTFLLGSTAAKNEIFEFSNFQLLSINSDVSDFGTAVRGDTLNFSSARGSALSNTIYSRTGQYYTKIYETTLDKNGAYTDPKLLYKGKNSQFNESTPVFTNDGKTMYYTRNIISDTAQVGGFELCKSIFENGNWVPQGTLMFEQKESVKVAHPALSPDGRSLYFASDMSGTYGDSDLFKIEIGEDGSFGKIIHLPNSINTEGRETFPFVTKSNILIFATDGHPGLGGLDLFSFDLNDPNAKAKHLGEVINSPYDDFGLMINIENNKGYFTSNKPGGIGDDDIYSFNFNEKVMPIAKNKEELLSLEVVVRDFDTNHVVTDVSIGLTDKSSKNPENSITNSEGNVIFNSVKSDAIYKLRLEKDNYIAKEVEVRINNESASITVLLTKMADKNAIENIPTAIGYDVAADLKIDKINFDSNQFKIREDAKVKLDNLVSFMNLHPQVNIEIGSHTDSWGTTKYNLILSQKRAQATLNYLVSRGIEASRLIAVGYGESKLLNKCSDGVKCPGNKHEANRRSTFMIIK